MGPAAHTHVLGSFVFFRLSSAFSSAMPTWQPSASKVLGQGQGVGGRVTPPTPFPQLLSHSPCCLCLNLQLSPHLFLALWVFLSPPLPVSVCLSDSRLSLCLSLYLFDCVRLFSSATFCLLPLSLFHLLSCFLPHSFSTSVRFCLTILASLSLAGSLLSIFLCLAHLLFQSVSHSVSPCFPPHQQSGPAPAPWYPPHLSVSPDICRL